MPIEIRELIIKVKVEETSKKTLATDLDGIKRELIQVCKKEVKYQLKKEREK